MATKDRHEQPFLRGGMRGTASLHSRAPRRGPEKQHRSSFAQVGNAKTRDCRRTRNPAYFRNSRALLELRVSADASSHHPQLRGGAWEAALTGGAGHRLTRSETLRYSAAWKRAGIVCQNISTSQTSRGEDHRILLRNGRRNLRTSDGREASTGKQTRYGLSNDRKLGRIWSPH